MKRIIGLLLFTLSLALPLWEITCTPVPKPERGSKCGTHPERCPQQ